MEQRRHFRETTGSRQQCTGSIERGLNAERVIFSLWAKWGKYCPSLVERRKYFTIKRKIHVSCNSCEAGLNLVDANNFVKTVVILC